MCGRTSENGVWGRQVRQVCGGGREAMVGEGQVGVGAGKAEGCPGQKRQGCAGQGCGAAARGAKQQGPRRLTNNRAI